MTAPPSDADHAIGEVLRGNRRGTVVLADNLDVLRSLPDACVDLAYADPPFAAGGARRLASIRTGAGERSRGGFGGRTYRYEVVSDLAYADDLPLEAHLAALRDRVVELHRVLAPHGSLYLHVDWRTVHHVRLLLDEVFGAGALPQRDRVGVRLRRAVHATAGRASTTRSCGTRGATDGCSTARRSTACRISRRASSGPEKAARGKLPTDVWWMTIVPPGSAERTGYPTQKPVRLLERIVAASSRPGDLVLDPYAGSGTTGIAAARLGRRWLLVDRHPDAVAIARARLDAEGRP